MNVIIDKTTSKQLLQRLLRSAMCFIRFLIFIPIFLFSIILNPLCFAGEKTLKTDYLVQPGDRLELHLPGEEGLNQTYDVDRRGRIFLPEIGELAVGGMTLSNLTEHVIDALSPVFRDVEQLSVIVKEHRMIIRVLGYVENPSDVVLPADADVQMALINAGGVRAGAQLDQFQLKRGDSSQIFNYKQYLDSGDESKLPQLQSMDEIFVPASPKTGNIEAAFNPASLTDAGDAANEKNAIKIFGEVRGPGSFSYNAGSTLVDYLMRAGGVTRYASVEKIRVISQNEPTLFSLKEYLDTGDSKLLPQVSVGATIFVPKQEEEIKAGKNMVYVMGEVKKPGAYESKGGATFLDILANAGGPTRYAESRQIRLIKQDGSVIPFDLTAYTELGHDGNLPKMSTGDAIFIPEKTDINEKSWLKVAPSRAVRVIGEVVHPGRFEWSDEMSLLDLIAHAGGPTSRADTSVIEIITPDINTGKTEKYTFNLDQFISSGYPDSKLPQIYAGAIVRVHDLPQDPSDNKSQWVRQSSADSIYIFGEVGAPGRYRFTDQMHFLDILAAADGPTKDADITNIKISHRDKTYATVTKFDLSLYFETGDENILPKVKPGDTIYLPGQAPLWLEQPKEEMVRVLGAVNKPGRYRFDDSMTILDLLAQAGGTSDGAEVKKISVVNLSCCKNQARIFNLSKFSRTADFSKLPLVRAGDTVYVPREKEGRAFKSRQGLRDIIQALSLVALFGAL